MSLQRHHPQGLYKAVGPYSPAVSFPLNHQTRKHQCSQKQHEPLQIVYISGQIPINPQTNLIDKPQIQWQTHQVMKNLIAALTGTNSSLKSVLKTTILLTSMQNFSKVNQIYGSYFKSQQYPARICFSVKELPKGSLIEIEAIAVRQNTIEGQLPSKKVKLSNDL